MIASPESPSYFCCLTSQSSFGGWKRPAQIASALRRKRLVGLAHEMELGICVAKKDCETARAHTHETHMHVPGSPILKFVTDISDMRLHLWNP